MRTLRLSFALVIIVAISLVATTSMAIDVTQNEEYKKAKLFLMEEKTQEAKDIFTKLLEENSGDLNVQLGLIDTTMEEARILQSKKRGGWKSKIYSAFGELKGLYRANATSHALYVSFAKCYWLNNRFGKAEKSLKKAFYYDPDNFEGLVLKGDMFFARSKIVTIDPNDMSASDRETYNRMRISRESYEKALSMNADPSAQAMIHFRLGDLYAYHHRKAKRAEQLKKAIEISPDSYWGVKAQEALNGMS